MNYRTLTRRLVVAALVSSALNLAAASGGQAYAQKVRPSAKLPAAPAVAAGSVIISEFRTSGPNGPNDEFFELYNTTTADITVASSDGSAGWSLVKATTDDCADVAIMATIPNGTILRASRHLLLAGSDYSLSAYPSGNGGPTTPDFSYAGQIENGRNFGLFTVADPLAVNFNTRLDAVGFGNTGLFCPTLSEGPGLLPGGGTTEYSFVRVKAGSGVPRDTNDNAADFVLVSTTPQQPVGDNPVATLGAPGPENAASPYTARARLNVVYFLNLDPNAGSGPPNRVRDFNVEPCAAQGSVVLRRTFVNNTGGYVTQVRLRLIDITTINNAPSGYAQLRVRNMPDEMVFVPSRGASVLVRGMMRETPPDQDQPRCGGLNTSLAPSGGISLNNPLPPGGRLDVAVRYGVEQGGIFRFFVIIEALP
ncbi:MAG TPA: lamin tail domain-containing protein [Pyrinomonadaceae bacterium]|jgi:hypothetical protein